MIRTLLQLRGCENGCLKWFLKFESAISGEALAMDWILTLFPFSLWVLLNRDREMNLTCLCVELHRLVMGVYSCNPKDPETISWLFRDDKGHWPSGCVAALLEVRYWNRFWWSSMRTPSNNRNRGSYSVQRHYTPVVPNLSCLFGNQWSTLFCM